MTRVAQLRVGGGLEQRRDTLGAARVGGQVEGAWRERRLRGEVGRGARCQQHARDERVAARARDMEGARAVLVGGVGVGVPLQELEHAPAPARRRRVHQRGARRQLGGRGCVHRPRRQRGEQRAVHARARGRQRGAALPVGTRGGGVGAGFEQRLHTREADTVRVRARRNVQRPRAQPVAGLELDVGAGSEQQP